MGWGKMTAVTRITNVQHARREIVRQLLDPEAGIEVLETTRFPGRLFLECNTGCLPLACDWCGRKACPGCGEDPIILVKAGSEDVELSSCGRWLCRARFHLRTLRTSGDSYDQPAEV